MSAIGFVWNGYILVFSIQSCKSPMSRSQFCLHKTLLKTVIKSKPSQIKMKSAENSTSAIHFDNDCTHCKKINSSLQTICTETELRYKELSGVELQARQKVRMQRQNVGRKRRSWNVHVTTVSTRLSQPKPQPVSSEHIAARRTTFKPKLVKPKLVQQVLF